MCISFCVNWCIIIATTLLHLYFSITSSLLHNCFLIFHHSYQWLSFISLWLHYHYFIITTSLLHHYYILTTWLLPHYYVSHFFIITSWFLPYYYPITSSLPHWPISLLPLLRSITSPLLPLLLCSTTSVFHYFSLLPLLPITYPRNLKMQSLVLYVVPILQSWGDWLLCL